MLFCTCSKTGAHRHAGPCAGCRLLPADAVDEVAALTFQGEVATTHELLRAVQLVFVDSFFGVVFRQHLVQRYGIRVEKLAHVLVWKTNFRTHA